MIADLNPYPDYKVSELSWLRQVPGHWSVRRIKTVLRETDHRSSDGSGTLLSLTRVRGLIPHKDMTDKMHSAKTLVGYKRYSAGQLVMNRMQAWSGMFGAGDIDGLVSPDYAVFDVFGGHSIKLVLELLKTPDLVAQFALESKGIGSGFNRLYTDRFGSIRISLPPPDEQAAIVRFLDWANGRLGRAIRAKRKVIALLNEQKQAIIHRAVTHGLDSSVPLKPSGIPWLGDIPQHWRISRLSQLSTRIGDGLHGTPQYVDQSPYYFINGNNLVNGDIRLKSSTRCVSENEFKKYLIALDDSSVLMSINGTIGSVACYRGESIILGKSAAYINCGMELIRNFLIFYLRSPAVINFLRSDVTGTTIFNLSLASVRGLHIPLPPVDEQIMIVSSIEDLIAPVSIAISRLEREIDLLRDYRTRLVADVVTGKLDVREAAAKLPVEEPGGPVELESEGLQPEEEEFTEEAQVEP
jgi:type I restriction enzyme S subunit